VWVPRPYRGFKSSFLMEHLVRAESGPELFQDIEGRVEPHLYSPVHCVADTARKNKTAVNVTARPHS